MILFQKDYAKYPNLIIDYKTKNQSFLDIAKLYRDMGIVNNVFMLTLLDPSLQGIDPHREDLPTTIKLKIAAEIYRNPWYYLREVARTPPQAGVDPSPVIANRSNIALFWCFLNHVTFFLIQPRQTGKSVNVDWLMSWLLGFRCSKTEIALLTKDRDLRASNITRIKDIINALPDYLNLRTKKDSNNMETITVKNRGNIYKAFVPQPSPKNANRIGRGLSTTIFHSDEGPFCPNIEISLKAALPGMQAMIEKAREAGMPYGSIFTTTAGKKDDRDGKYIYKLLQESAYWDEIYFDCKDEKDLEESVRRNSRIDRKVAPNGVFRINATFNHRQLGKTDEWLMRRIEESLNTDGDNANRDFFNIWTSGTETSPFPPEVAEAMALSRMDPVARTISEKGKFITKWYIPESDIQSYMDNEPCVFGFDASESIGRDDTTLHILNMRTMETVATGIYNNVNVYTIAEAVLDMMVKYPKLVGIIESKNMGVSLINYLLLQLPNYGFDPFKRLFNRIVQEHDDRADAFNEIRIHGKNPEVINKYRAYFGYSSSGTGSYSRDALYSKALSIATRKAGSKMYDIVLVDQTLSLVIKNNRIDHEDGAHDDMVIAWLLGIWLTTQGKKLDYYGISSYLIMKDTYDKDQNKITYQEAKQAYEQQMIREEMIRVYDEMSQAQDEWMFSRLENRLRSLNSRLILNDTELWSIDALIKQVKDQRRFNRYNSKDRY